MTSLRGQASWAKMTSLRLKLTTSACHLTKFVKKSRVKTFLSTYIGFILSRLPLCVYFNPCEHNFKLKTQPDCLALGPFVSIKIIKYKIIYRWRHECNLRHPLSPNHLPNGLSANLNTGKTQLNNYFHYFWSTGSSGGILNPLSLNKEGRVLPLCCLGTTCNGTAHICVVLT